MEEQYESPLFWAKKHGHVSAPDPRKTLNTEPVLSVQYRVADRLYRWSEHDYHYCTEPFTLQECDFEDAMLAASLYPNVEPHEEALTPFARSLRAKKEIK